MRVLCCNAQRRPPWELPQNIYQPADRRKQRRSELQAARGGAGEERFVGLGRMGSRTLRNPFDLPLVLIRIAHRRNIVNKMSGNQNLGAAAADLGRLRLRSIADHRGSWLNSCFLSIA